MPIGLDAMLILLGAGLFVLGLLWFVGRNLVGRQGERPPGLRVLQVTFLVADVVLLVAWLSFGQGDSIQPVRGVEALSSALWVILWWSSPSLLRLVHRTRTGSLVTGVALLGAAALGLGTMYTSTGSSAAIGFVTLPVLFWLLAAALLLGEYLMVRPWRLSGAQVQAREGLGSRSPL